MRTAAMVRHPGTVPEGVVTEQMLSAHDWYKTFAAFAGASDKVPTDRPMDGVDASEFLLGTSEETGRETLLFFGPDGSLMSSKWRQVKVVLRHYEGIDQPIVQPQFPLFFDLGGDPGEHYNLFQFKLDMGWMFGVASKAIAEYEKTVAEFPNIERGAEFDGYPAPKAKAELFGNSFVFAGLLPDDFPPTRGVVASPWWREVDGADWRHPEGPHSDVTDRGDHPVVQVSWDDAMSFCDWSRTKLPTEAQWECAARGGRSGSHYPWGDDREPNGEHRMNVFQGDFPGRNTGDDGWIGTSPADHFPPNGFGLHQVTGNVWEWCLDWFAPSTYHRTAAVDPVGPPDGAARVMRGGSYLCHESYCWRHRVDARSANQTDSTAGNIGFRVVATAS